MNRQTTRVFTLAGTLALGVAVGVVVLSGGKPAPAPVLPSESDSLVSPESVRSLGIPEEPKGIELPPRAAAAGSRAADHEIPPDEESLMAKLRRLGETNPPLSLELARAGNDRYPTSPHAAERGWRLVKSLVNLKRFEEARAEAVILVDQHRDTPWAQDVARHLLVNPLTHPSERGYSGTDPPPTSEH